MQISNEPKKGWVCPSCVTLLTNGDDVEENEAKRQKVEKEIDLKKFENFVVKNKKNIMACMHMTALPKTRNPLASFNNSQELLKLLCYEDAMQLMLDYINTDKDFRKLQATSSLVLRNARFENAFITFTNKFLSEC